MKALVLGSGKSGEAAKAVLLAQGYEVESVEGFDLVVASPGVPVKSELQVGCERLKRCGTKLLAVTGSKGKSSVVKLVAEAVGGVPCGNYGLPVSAVGPCEWAVVEVSSFQLETTHLPRDTFEAAAILNLQADHLDRHGGADVYHALKRALLGMTPRPIASPEDVPDAPELYQGSYFDNEVLRGNARIAVALMRVAGLRDEAIRAAFRSFRPLPHRLQPIAEIDGVRYVDDSKATSVAALDAGVRMAASKCTGGIRLIAGGRPKGDNPKSALPVLTKQVKKVYLIGESAEVFSKAWSGEVACEICGTLERAVEVARREAVKGEVVLLSPGTASFDQFKSFEERGDAFADFVKKGKKE